MMPSEVMDERSFSPSSYFYDEIRFPAQRQVGFWKPELTPDHHGVGLDVMSRTTANKAVVSSPLDMRLLMEAQSMESLRLPQSSLVRDQAIRTLEQHAAESDRKKLASSWKSVGHSLGTRSNIYVQPSSSLVKSNTVDMNGAQHENGLFSSSLSEIFNKKLTLSSNDVLFGQSVNVASAHYYDEEPFESLEEIEAQTIGNLLPDDDDLLSGVYDELDCIAQPSNGDDIEEFDLFCSGGGMELEGEEGSLKCMDLVGENSNGQQGVIGASAGEHPYGEHPSRTLFVRNINSNVEDSELKLLFEQYGDIRTLYTACKHRGFVMISYYDIRAARNAMRALQNKPLRRRKLDIHFSIPKDNPSERDINQGTLVVFNLDSSVSNDVLRQIFGVYGEIKEIRETPHKRHHKFIEYYDVRAAEAALRALNRTDIAGKRIKLEPSRPGGARRCTLQQFSPELEQEEFGVSQQHGSPPDNSPSGCFESVTHSAVTSGCVEIGSFQELNSAAGAPINSVVENGFRNSISSSIPHSLTSSLRVASAGSVLCEPNHPLGQMKFGFQGVPNFHPHSLPEYHDSLANGLPFNSPGTLASMSRSISSVPSEVVDIRHMRQVGAGGISRELNEGGNYNESLVFGSAGNGSCPLHGHQFAWNNSSSFNRRPPNPIMLPNSTTFVHAIPRGPSQMNSGVPIRHHHVGSAPAVNPSLWDRRQAFAMESPEVSGFQSGSFGNIGLSGSSGMHPLGIASHDIFPHVGANCMDPTISSTNIGLNSPQQRFHMFPNRNSIVPMPNSFDVPNERVRSRRNDAVSSQGENKRQFELDIDRIMGGEDLRTTLMIKNIPNKYTSKMLLAAIDERHRGTYDFIYLPIDFKNKCNVGYAFINMIDPLQIVPFYQAFNGKKWEKFNSEKVASLAYARIQGKAALVAHFQNSSLMNEDKRCRPILFHSDGPNAGDQEPFPMGVNIRSRAGKPRTSSYEDYNQGSPLTSTNWEESSLSRLDPSSASAKETD
ncbi:Mei2-like [Thalictrum thalictroides]|uniref:Mei2-like n=1 Tax=Thalictrum thalictroides TaxID=46969 RepID=A0A7J6WGZ9_THATH|nr:Mei2-like [Thalictrum thalictroides]